MEPNVCAKTNWNRMFQLPGVSRGSGPCPAVRLTHHCGRQCGVCALSNRRRLLLQARYFILQAVYNL